MLLVMALLEVTLEARELVIVRVCRVTVMVPVATGQTVLSGLQMTTVTHRCGAATSTVTVVHGGQTTALVGKTLAEVGNTEADVGATLAEVVEVTMGATVAVEVAVVV